MQMHNAQSSKHPMTNLAVTNEEDVMYLEERLSNARDIALFRLQTIESSQHGLALVFTPLLQEAVDGWLGAVKKRSIGSNALVIREEIPMESTRDWKQRIRNAETRILLRILRMHAFMSRMDPTLGEELGREGSHAILLRLIQQPPLECICENDQEDSVLLVLQDVACETASLGSFPIKYAPFSRDELKLRLPLVFEIKPVFLDDTQTSMNSQKILIHQVTTRQSAQKDVGFVMWPSAVVLSRYIATNAALVEEKDVLELGAGCGLVGLVSAGCKAKSVTMTDFNDVVLENLQRNIDLNQVVIASCKELDFYKQTGTNMEGWLDKHGNIQEQVDVVLAADIICQPQDAVAAANSIHDALRPGGTAVVVCANAQHRFGMERFESELLRVGLKVSVVADVSELYDGQLLDTSMDLTMGYVKGMTLSMFTIEKPVR